MRKQCGRDEVDDEGPPLRNALGGERIDFHQSLDDWRRAEIENNDCDHGWDELRGVDGSEFSRRDSFTQHLTKLLIDGLEVTPRDAFHLADAVGASAYPFPLHDPWKTRVRSNVVE